MFTQYTASCISTLGALVVLQACTNVQNSVTLVDKVQPAMSIKTEQALVRNVEILHELVTNTAVIEAVHKHSTSTANTSVADLQRFDVQMQQRVLHEGVTGTLFTGTAALLLLEFQEQYSGFVEVFITDIHGVNVAQTNTTSDYYQADEQWWRMVFAGGKGHSYYGDIEYDHSALSESVALHVPIKTSDGEMVGVLKAVLDVTALLKEFWQVPQHP